MSTVAIDERARSVPALGGFNSTLLRLELRRLLRNRRTVIFTLIMPPVFFLIFGTQQSYRTQSAGHGNVTAYVAVSMAVYGAMLACTGGGATVSVERAQGWSRQLRLTPLSSVAYIAVKTLVAMVMGLASVVMVFVVGASGSMLIPALQTRLLDASPDAPSLASSLNHAALNVANALGAFLGGLVIALGWGFVAPALVGAVLAVLGFGVALLSGLLERKRPLAA